jgi:hypothetical protein
MDPVNSLTGAFITSETDLVLASKGLEFAFTRSYTSADPTSGRLGQYLGLALSNVTLGTDPCCSGIVSVLKSDETTLTIGRSIGRSIGTNGGTTDLPILPYTGSYTIFVDPVPLATGSLTFTLSEDLTSTIGIGGPSTTVNIPRIGQERARYV